MTYRMIFFRFLFIFCCLSAFKGLSQNASDVFDYWPHRPDPSTALYQKILEGAFEQLDARADHIASLKEDRESWIEYQKVLSRKLESLLVPKFEKSDLKPIITGRIDRPEFIVEKLIFESLPGYPVSAAMFIPKVRANPAAAILFCSGHSDEGFRSPVYQHMILNYVMKGFIVLAFDPVGQEKEINILSMMDKKIWSNP
ncbi:MAG: hypothetical protein IPL46_16660 [Saprospiraceae bacterium]|nr:hypothetical protein [Saprospiraceae bacterium]